jgi:hypothetical protein
LPEIFHASKSNIEHCIELAETTEVILKTQLNTYRLILMLLFFEAYLKTARIEKFHTLSH